MNATVVKRKICNQLIQQVDEFPPLPAIVSKILMVTSDPESSIDDLKVLVESEVALASSILKLANSPFFGLCREVASIPHALTVLGLDEVKNLVLAKAMFNTFKGFRNKGELVNGLWRHSFYTGLAATLIARRIGHHSSDFFVAGLIHDIGKMVIYLALNKENIEKLYLGLKPMEHMDTEIKRLGIDHQELGAELLRSWMFPESLQSGVGFHHHPEDSTGNLEVPLVLSLADMLVYLVECGRSSDEAIETMNRWLSKPSAAMFLTKGLELNSESVDLLLDGLEKALLEADSLAALLS
jgi:putative nucleotidyltransferase with HDIG domain